MSEDPDFDWLLEHLKNANALPERRELAQKVVGQVVERVRNGELPHTLGIFGGWGSGKTTFLALLSKQLNGAIPDASIIYFNSWKYAGLTEIVPALIYKILKQGVPDTSKEKNKAVLRVLASLGSKYSDKLGKWAEERIGINPAELFEDATNLLTTQQPGNYVSADIVEEYYTQVDRAQDALEEALGTIAPGRPVKNPVIILIDELDRCDPDEAFAVIKQLRVLFAMRRLPTLFIICANPEPIGLAIKHRYGLDSESGDYEARHILEKFVDAYENFSESVALGKLAKTLWEEVSDFPTPWIVSVDEANGDADFGSDVVHNATVFDMMNSSIPYYSNLRVFRKSLYYLEGRHRNTNQIWTLWHLKLAEQVDLKLRTLLQTIAESLRIMALRAYQYIESELHFHVEDKRIVYESDKGKTLFAILRSCLWEAGLEDLKRLNSLNTPEDSKKSAALQELLKDDHKMNFVASLCLLHLPKAQEFGSYIQSRNSSFGKVLANDEELHHFAWLIRHG